MPNADDPQDKTSPELTKALQRLSGLSDQGSAAPSAEAEKAEAFRLHGRAGNISEEQATQAADSYFAAFVKERDEMLAAGDVDRALAFHAKHNPEVPTPSREVAELGLHKARTICLSLPLEARLASKRWLEAHGSRGMDDGELAAAEQRGRLSQIEQDLPDPDALWRAGLPAELRPIALRAGRTLFVLCANINNAAVGLAGIGRVAAETRATLDQLHARKAAQAVMQKLHSVHQVLDGSIATLIAGWAEAAGFSREQLLEVQTDMKRATQLAQAAPPSNIVLPGGGH